MIPPVETTLYGILLCVKDDLLILVPTFDWWMLSPKPTPWLTEKSGKTLPTLHESVPNCTLFADGALRGFALGAS